MATKTEIVNAALIRLGEARLADVDADDTTTSRLCAAIYDQILDEVTAAGPEKGWKFARRRYHGIDDDSVTITAFAQASSTTTTVTATHTLVAGDMVEIDGTTNYDGDYDVVSVTGTTSFVITETFVADDATGTARWTSEEYEYRYAIPTTPTVLRVVSAQVGGVELTDWVREGNYILTNQESDEIDLEIVQSVTTTTLFPPHFIKVLSMSLVVELAYSLVQNKALAERLLLELEEKVLPRAIAMDEQEKYVQEESSAWVDIGRTLTTIE